ncbi:MAG: TAXI family TRAP transporter solute-binding subunit [Chloroflexi bacterium]|nr:TAXI family TRAP transporter solute-binding subunit [Chloroflexota bacterium]
MIKNINNSLARLFPGRKRIMVTTLLILLSLLLSCCVPAVQKPTTSIIIAGASKGGVWNPLAKELARILPQYVPGITFSDQETLGSIDNLKLLVSGKAQLIFAHDYHVAKINQGLLPAVSTDKVPVRVVMGLYEQPLQIVIRKDSGITNLSDLRGKRVSTGVPGGCAEEMAGFVLTTMGIDIDKDIQREKMDVIPSATALKENKIDAFFWTGAIPTATIANLFTEIGSEVSLLSIDTSSAELIMKDNPGVYHTSMIQTGAYPGLDKDVETLAITAVIATMDTFPFDTLTKILAAIFDHRDELAGGWSGAPTLSPVKSLGELSDEAFDYLHPAATHFFLASVRNPESQKEMGEIWLGKCLEAGYEGSQCADQLLSSLRP